MAGQDDTTANGEGTRPNNEIDISDPNDDLHEEYHQLDSKLDELNTALDMLEQKNDDIHEKLKKLLQSNIDIREELRNENLQLSKNE